MRCIGSLNCLTLLDLTFSSGGTLSHWCTEQRVNSAEKFIANTVSLVEEVLDTHGTFANVGSSLHRICEVSLRPRVVTSSTLFDVDYYVILFLFICFWCIKKNKYDFSPCSCPFLCCYYCAKKDFPTMHYYVTSVRLVALYRSWNIYDRCAEKPFVYNNILSRRKRAFKTNFILREINNQK